MVTYYFISDNLFFLKGIEYSVKENQKISCNSVLYHQLGQESKSFVFTPNDVVIVAISNHHRRWHFLSKLASFRCRVILIVECQGWQCAARFSPWWLPGNVSAAVLMETLCNILNAPLQEVIVPFRISYVFSFLSTGGTLRALAESLGIDEKKISLIRQQFIKSLGVPKANALATLYLRDFLLFCHVQQDDYFYWSKSIGLAYSRVVFFQR
ncbi:MAG: hypothetical protein ACRC0C_00530 [Gibbsiella quercinecans]|uniref:hypothetical protein n=1 Tax=Gibbsiella quercinecans TaxID=929813 RepID=UPI003F31014C